MESLLEEKLHPAQTGLIVIDIQNDFCHEHGAFSKGKRDLSMIQEIIPRLLGLIEHVRKVRLPVIYVRTTHDDWTNSNAYLQINKLRKRSPICSSGTWGAEFFKLSPQRDEYIVTKHRYSAFQGTDLEMVLRSRGIETLLVSGIMTNVCVESTLRDAFSRDFFPILLEDCVASDRRDLHRATIENVRDYFGIVTCTEALLKIWQQRYGKKFL